MTDEPGSGSTGPFVAHRSLLFTVAYEILGSAADAEDVVQETWLRWSARFDETGAQAGAEEIRDPRSYLVRIATRQALNRLRSQQRRRETYVGPWLPEPLLTTPDVAEDVELADSVSTAMLLVLETLGPTERAVFVLREVFDLPFDEIAEAVGKSPSAVRQIAHRARSNVHARRPRQDVTAEERDRVIERFLAAAATGDIQSLMDVLAPDVVLVSDGGGQKKAALRPIHGRDKVLRFLAATSQNQGEITTEVLTVNGGPALALSIDGALDTVATFVIEDGVVTGLYLLRNPEKLSRLGQVVDLTR